MKKNAPKTTYKPKIKPMFNQQIILDYLLDFLTKMSKAILPRLLVCIFSLYVVIVTVVVALLGAMAANAMQDVTYPLPYLVFLTFLRRRSLRLLSPRLYDTRQRESSCCPPFSHCHHTSEAL